VNQAVECYKCWRSQWRATGYVERHRRGYLRAELVCLAKGCGYRFFSNRPVALAAARLARPHEPAPQPVLTRCLPPEPVGKDDA
jgi:hypothetical protein